jgi:hypothetical protein
VAMLAVAVGLTFWLSGSWPIRIAAIALAVIALPVLLTISFDRRIR